MPGSSRQMLRDPVLADRILIAEPWDLGPDGYQLGNFPQSFLEWNDRYRDDLRRFWRGDEAALGALATRLAGSSDVFRRNGEQTTRSVNFIAAHDGFSLADTVAYEDKHNEANGEHNHDGHNENFSWNNGVEGASGDKSVQTRRRRDMKALIASLFASRGTIMLTAGDEFGRTQKGNNNAYAQDNAVTWLDWEGRDEELEDFATLWSALRRRLPPLADPAFLNGEEGEGSDAGSAASWLHPEGRNFTIADWHEPHGGAVAMVLGSANAGDPTTRRVAVLFNRRRLDVEFAMPRSDGWIWRRLDMDQPVSGERITVGARSVALAVETIRSA